MTEAAHALAHLLGRLLAWLRTTRTTDWNPL